MDAQSVASLINLAPIPLVYSKCLKKKQPPPLHKQFKTSYKLTLKPTTFPVNEAGLRS